MQKKVIVIGAGISGLSAGCYARMNGYDTQIFEAHNIPGGLCTAWKRKGFTVDGCIHWLTGSKPPGAFYHIWEELGAVQGRKIYDHEIFARMVALDGRRLDFYTNIDRFEDHLRELSPQDGGAIKELCGWIRKLLKFSWPVDKAPELMGRMDGLKMMASMLPYMKDLTSVGGLTLGQLGAHFTDPLIRKAISNVLFDESLPAAALVMTLGPMSQKTAGFPIGGSLEFSRTIEKRFLDLGGKVTYRTKVPKIVQRNGRVVGVQLADGSEVPADYVIAASDLRTALYSLLESTEIDPIHKLLLDEGKLYPPSILVTFGVDHVFPQEISCLGTTYELEQPITIADQKKKFFGVKNFNYDPSLSPEGKSIVGTVFATDWDFWEKLKGKDQDYQSAQDQIVKTCIEQIEKHFPGFSSRIEMTDIATPITMERYTGNWKGTYMTWILSGEFQRKYRYIPKTVPGLEGFYLASMWTNPPGGVPGAASAGRGVIQLICSKDRQRFTTSTP